MLSVSMLVERNIDGMWFPAEVLRTDSASGMVSLKYIDDGNIEDMVPSCEVRIPLRDSHSSSPRVDKKVTLPKPLLGLMEDDCAERYNHLPKTIVHANDDDDDSDSKAVIINGSSQTLAAGGGMRALRYLRK